MTNGRDTAPQATGDLRKLRFLAVDELLSDL